MVGGYDQQRGDSEPKPERGIPPVDPKRRQSKDTRFAPVLAIADVKRQQEDGYAREEGQSRVCPHLLGIPHDERRQGKDQSGEQAGAWGTGYPANEVDNRDGGQHEKR